MTLEDLLMMRYCQIYLHYIQLEKLLKLKKRKKIFKNKLSNIIKENFKFEINKWPK